MENNKRNFGSTKKGTESSNYLSGEEKTKVVEDEAKNF